MTAHGETELDELRAEVARLREIVSTLQRPALPQGEHGWSEHHGQPDGNLVSHRWLTSLAPAKRSRRPLPRLPLEALFLVACAAAAGLAGLEPLVIAAVMAAAWLLASLVEWSAARADRLRRIALLGTPISKPPAPDTGGEADRAWFVPPVDRTIIVRPDDDEQTSLPAPSSNMGAELTIERPTSDT